MAVEEQLEQAKKAVERQIKIALIKIYKVLGME